jgi:DHA1 family multidrug resistance protein-like MFS transporter
VFFLLTFLSLCGLMIFANIFGLYALERFGYGTREVGIIMMALGLASAVGQGTLVGPLTKRWGNLIVIKVSLLATIAGFGLMVLASTFVTVLLATAFFGLAVALQIPALTSLTSQRATVPQGVTMGLSEAFVSLGRIVGPLLGGITFDINLNLPYLTGAAVLFIGFLVSLIGVPPDDSEAKARHPA